MQMRNEVTLLSTCIKPTGLEKTHRVTSSQQVAKQLLLLRLAKRMMTCKIELQIRLAHICNISTFDEN